MPVVDYGNTVGQGAGHAGGGVGNGGGDAGAQVVDTLSSVVDRVAALPPEMLVILAVFVLAGLLVLKRAF